MYDGQWLNKTAAFFMIISQQSLSYLTLLSHFVYATPGDGDQLYKLPEFESAMRKKCMTGFIVVQHTERNCCGCFYRRPWVLKSF